MGEPSLESADRAKWSDGIPKSTLRCHLQTVSWLADQVVWLAPEPNTPILELTKLVSERWPESPPYGSNPPTSFPI
jgi:hypothetical protein